LQPLFCFLVIEIKIVRNNHVNKGTQNKIGMRYKKCIIFSVNIRKIIVILNNIKICFNKNIDNSNKLHVGERGK